MFGVTMTETLRIDTGLVLEAGGRLQAVAGAIPPPPPSFSPPGADALSMAIAGKVAEVVDPVVAQLPLTKEAMQKYAQNVVDAANTYDRVDRQIAEEILERLQELDAAKAAGGTGGGSPGGSTGTSGSTRAASTAAQTGASSTVPTAAQPGGDMSQMTQMPMQMAQQVAQAPAQMAGMVGAVPGAMMQGVQGAVQQVSQLSGQEKQEDGAATNPEDTQDDQREQAVTQPDPQAAAGDATGERVPDRPRPKVGQQSPEIAL
jgi:hypothetical protein